MKLKHYLATPFESTADRVLTWGLLGVAALCIAVALFSKDKLLKGALLAYTALPI